MNVFFKVLIRLWQPDLLMSLSYIKHTSISEEHQTFETCNSNPARVLCEPGLVTISGSNLDILLKSQV